MRYLRSRRLLGTSRHRELVWKLDLRQVHPDLAEFLRVFYRAAGRLGVPLHAEGGKALAVRQYVTELRGTVPSESPFTAGTAVRVLSSVYGDKLPPLAWEVLGHLGQEIAKRNSLPILWGGHSRPCHWSLDLA